jgi:hypothetical protein
MRDLDEIECRHLRVKTDGRIELTIRISATKADDIRKRLDKQFDLKQRSRP